MNIELYIGDRLCDIGNPENLGIYLKRVFIKPSELSMKDAQKSYEISLPATPTNNEIFNYTNVEEVQGKFKVYDNARLYIDGVLILDGKFRMSQITKDAYNGNLGVPAPKTVKDIFGETKLTENAPLEMTFNDFASSVNYWNGKAKNGDLPDCIFPFALYGLLPKTPLSTGITDYSPADLWDNTVRIGIEDLPPSINVLNMLKHIFDTKGYTLTGTALNDARLNSLYMSYRNEENYQQEWNWGDLGKVSVEGVWSIADTSNGKDYKNFERQISLNDDEYGGYYTVNLFNSNRANLTFDDEGTNVIYSKYKDKYPDNNGYTYTRRNLLLSIPQSGYYKVRLTCNDFKLNRPSVVRTYTDDETENKFISTVQSIFGLGNNLDNDGLNNSFRRSRYEIQVLRDYGTGEFKNTNIVGFYNRPQFPQESFDVGNGQFPKYYPMAKGPMVIDPCVNENFICGLHWGEHEDDKNPKDKLDRCNYMFIANGFSWDKQFSQNKKILNAYSSWNKNRIGNYWCWGTIDEESEVPVEGDSPKLDWLDNPVKRRYSKLGNYADDVNYVEQSNDIQGEGCVECIIWLEKGEKLTVGIAGDMGDRSKEYDQWIVLIDNVDFKLEVEPFRTDITWNNFTNKGSYVPEKLLSWTIGSDDPANFRKGKIDLIKFLPNNISTDEFINNFCKAFNLNLSQTGIDKFSLDTKQTKGSQQYGLVDIDAQTAIKDRVNESLGLPSIYSIGFTVNKDEQGFVESGKDDGGGMFYTGSSDDGTIEQKSNFSYNWFKNIRKAESGNQTVDIPLPVISKAEVWVDGDTLYSERMSKQYTDLPQRFWYFDGLLNDLGVSFNIGSQGNEKSLKLAKVTNTLPELNTLSYKNENDTILTNYFSLLTDASSNYTLIECYLTPDQYNKIGEGANVRLNGDLYYVAEIDGYDPLNKKKCKLKLIRKMI